MDNETVMTKERLEQYRSYRQEIKEIMYRLFHPDEDDTLFGNDTILDYSTGYPRPQAVVGFDNAEYQRRKRRWEKRLEFLHNECDAVDTFIESIKESQTRRMFYMYYTDGKEQITQEEVAKRIHRERSWVSKKIDGYLKNHTNHINHIYNDNRVIGQLGDKK